MFEKETERVAATDERRVIEVKESFGWRLISCERNGAYSIGEKDECVILTFERDKEMPSYSEITMLEEKYRSNLREIPPKPSKTPLPARIWLGITAANSLLFTLCFLNKPLFSKIAPFFLLSGTIILLSVIPLAIILIRSEKKRKEEWRKHIEAENAKIIADAKVLKK